MNRLDTEITGEEPAMPHFHHEGRSGLSIRQQFAMAAMQGFSANPNFQTTSFSTIAEYSVQQADALIAELNKSK